MADCLFCKMIQKQVKANIEYEDDHVLAIQDINPQAPVHVLVIPKQHVEGIDRLGEEHCEMIGRVIITAQRLARQKGWKDYRLVFNNGAGAGQSIFHIHLHLLSGRRFHWPPG